MRLLKKLKLSCAVIAFVMLPAGGQADETAGSRSDNPVLACGAPMTASVTDGLITLSPIRGWQMEGRDIEISIISRQMTETTKPILCARWKRKDGKGSFLPIAHFRIAERTQRPAGIKLIAPVPDLGTLPSGHEQEPVLYTRDNAAPVAEIRLILQNDDGKAVEDFLVSFGVVAIGDYCNVPNLGTRVDSGSVIPSASKKWQPTGGEIEFALQARKSVPDNALIKSCFRWKLTDGDPGKFSESGPIRVLERQPQTLKLGVTIPKFASNNLAGTRAYAAPFVPIADVRVLLFDNELNAIADVWTNTGITSVFLASVIALLTLGLGFSALWVVCRRRFQISGNPNPFLCLIATRNGFASLSQFQIMLWTFVVIASAAYVIALSGDLIPITAGTLVLLGISGAAIVISKAKTEQDAASPAPIDSAAAAAEAVRAEDRAKEARAAADLATGESKQDAELLAEEEAAKAEAAKAKAAAVDAIVAAAKARAAVVNATDKSKADAEAQAAEQRAEAAKKAAAILEAKASKLMRVRHPLWSDLVMEEVKGRELDIARVQMLFFTLVTAIFVLIKVITSYEIPNIPEGFLILMGISNSVYIGSKFAAR